MSATACTLDPDALLEQLERYRAIGRRAVAVEHEPGRVLVRFADDPPRALIERTLEVERGCCPFLQIEYQPAARSLAISVDHPDRRPSLDLIADALGESRAADLLPESEPGVTSCCSSTSLQTCCQPSEKQDCCGQPAGEKKDVAPSRCGCNT